MKQKQRPAPLPPRKELRDTPIKRCNEISRLIHARLRREGEMDGILTQPGARSILSRLAISDGQSQLELVRATLLSAPTVSVILRKMEEEGIVERRSDDKDMRVMRVYLTEYGHALDQKTIARIRKADESALQGLRADELETLMVLLDRIRGNLIAAEEADEKTEEA